MCNICFENFLGKITLAWKDKNQVHRIGEEEPYM
jgi:hypothetical protein